MNLAADRIAGLGFIVFGLLLYFMIIPAQTEPAEAGVFVAAATVPNTTAWLLALLGVLLCLNPSGSDQSAAKTVPRAALFLAIIVIGVALMSKFGFIWVSAPLVLALIWTMGERRVIWLAVTVVLVPASIWVLVVPVLGRVLP